MFDRKGYSTMAWTPFFLKMTMRRTFPKLLQIVWMTSCGKKKTIISQIWEHHNLIQVNNSLLEPNIIINWEQAFSQRGVWVIFGYPIADFGYFCVWCNGMKWNWTPNLPQMCIFGHPILKSWLKPWLRTRREHSQSFRILCEWHPVQKEKKNHNNWKHHNLIQVKNSSLLERNIVNWWSNICSCDHCFCDDISDNKEFI